MDKTNKWVGTLMRLFVRARNQTWDKTPSYPMSGSNFKCAPELMMRLI